MQRVGRKSKRSVYHLPGLNIPPEIACGFVTLADSYQSPTVETSFFLSTQKFLLSTRASVLGHLDSDEQSLTHKFTIEPLAKLVVHGNWRARSRLLGAILASRRQYPCVAEAGQMFGKACIKVKGKAFLSQHKDWVVFKLSGEHHRHSLALDGATLWDPSGKG